MHYVNLFIFIRVLLFELVKYDDLKSWWKKRGHDIPAIHKRNTTIGS